MSSLGQHFSQINLKKKQKNKSYKAFSRYRTDLSLVGLNSLPYMFFLRPPAERCFPSLSWIPLLSFQHLPLLLQLSHGLLAVFQQIKLLKNNSSRKKKSLVIVVFLSWPYYITLTNVISWATSPFWNSIHAVQFIHELLHGRYDLTDSLPRTPAHWR